MRVKPWSTQEVGDDAAAENGIVRKDRGDRVGRRVDRHDRHALDLAEAAEEFRAGVGGHHHDGVDALGEQRAHVGDEALRDVVGVADHQRIAGLEAGPLDAADDLAEERVRRGGDDHADGAGAAGFQRARELGGQVAELGDRLVDARRGVAADRPRLVDDVRDRRERDVGAPGDVLDGDHRRPESPADARLQPAVEGHGEDQDQADDDALRVGRDVVELQPVLTARRSAPRPPPCRRRCRCRRTARCRR